MGEQNASYLAKHVLRIRLKKFKQNSPENCSKSTKIAITACKFLKFFRGSMPSDPLKLLLFLNQLQFVLPKIIRLKRCGNCDPPFKISRYATEYILPLLIDSIVCRWAGTMLYLAIIHSWLNFFRFRRSVFSFKMSRFRHIFNLISLLDIRNKSLMN